MVIKTKEDKDMCTSDYGNLVFTLTIDDLIAIVQGYTLGDPDFDEYGVFIKLIDSDDLTENL